MKLTSRILAFAAAVVALCASAPRAASAQDMQSELQSWRVPGWSFTPGVAIGWVFDNNVAIAGPDPFGKTDSDTLMQVEPFGQLEFFSPRTSFSSGYRGAVRRYFELRDLDGVDHRLYATLRHRISRRVMFFMDESFQQSPTTDALELNGVPFQRTGTRYNMTSAGVDARLSKSLDLKTRYEVMIADFLSGDAIDLTGGFVQGAFGSLTHRFDERASAGGEYAIRIADMNDGLRQYVLHSTGGVFEYRTGEHTTVDLAGGMTHLIDRLTDLRRTGPYWRAAVMHRLARARIGGEYERSYTPSFSLGGTNRSHEVRGYVDMPFYRNRFYLGTSALLRRSDPFTQDEPPLTSTWIRSTLGYAVRRWLRIEGQHTFTNQDNRLAGGRITRQVAGIQVVVSEPMRIR